MEPNKLIDRVVEHFDTQAMLLIDLYRDDKISLEFVIKSENVQYKNALKLSVQLKFFELLSKEDEVRLRRRIDEVHGKFNTHVLNFKK